MTLDRIWMASLRLFHKHHHAVWYLKCCLLQSLCCSAQTQAHLCVRCAARFEDLCLVGERCEPYQMTVFAVVSVICMQGNMGSVNQPCMITAHQISAQMSPFSTLHTTQLLSSFSEPMLFIDWCDSNFNMWCMTLRQVLVGCDCLDSVHCQDAIA